LSGSDVRGVFRSAPVGLQRDMPERRGDQCLSFHLCVLHDSPAGQMVAYGTISTAFVESTINQVVSRRFVKKQQMQWTLRGAHLLLQTRTRVLNEDLDDVFRRWYPNSGRNHKRRSQSGRRLDPRLFVALVKPNTGPRKENYRALPYGVTVSLITRRTRLVGLLNRPQRKSLSRTESGILKVNKINPAIVTSTDQRFVVSKNEGGERASIFPGLNSNDHVILVDQLMGGDNFCGNGGHSRHSLRNKSRPVESASLILFSKD
jgi:hypothetical protein